MGMTYDEFVAARLQPLLRYAVMLTGDPHLAEDLVQDTMVRVQLHWRRVAAADVPEIYVRRMLTNAFVDLRRGSWLRRVILRADPDETVRAPAPGPDDTTADRDEVWVLLATLPPRQRAALVLRFYEALSDAEVAHVLDCPVGTVRSLISRGLARLRTTVGERTAVAGKGEPR
jgi:RNA polymerase sigma-70 factor (sigma-E family)